MTRHCRRAIVLTVLLLPLAGCASSGGSTGGATDAATPADEAGAASDVRELYIRDFMETWIPRESYFAVFEILPDRGVSLLYPTRPEELRQVPAGIHRLPHSPSGFVHAQRDRYIQPVRSRYVRAQSVILMVVTSSLPLNLDPILAEPRGLRDLLGPQAYIDDNRAVERILASIVPDPVAAAVEYKIASVDVPAAWMIRR